MKKINIIASVIVIFTIAVSFTAFSKERVSNVTNTTRNINIDKNFSGIHIYAGIEVNYTQDNKAARALISGPAEIVDKIEWEINSKGILSFKLPSKKIGYNGKISIQLNGGFLNDYSASSGGTINVITPVKGKDALNFAVSSSGNILLSNEVEAIGKEINIAGASSGEIIFSSSVRSQTVNIALSSSSTVKFPVLINSATRYAGSSTGILELGNVIMQEFDVALASGAECSVKEGKIQELNISCASGGEFMGRDIKVNEMALSSASGGTITLKGSCNKASMSAASGGDIDLSGMKIANIKSQKASSGGGIYIR